MTDSMFNETPPADSGAGAGENTPPAGGERPAWLPEKFKTPEALADGYVNLTKKLASRADEQRAEILAGITPDDLSDDLRASLNAAQRAAAGVPEAADGYTIPDGLTVVDDALAKEFFALSHEVGIGQEGFDKLLGLYAKAAFPDHEAEVKALGENGEQRMRAVTAFMKSSLGEDDFGDAARFLTTASSIRIVEKLMEAAKMEGTPDAEIEGDPLPSDAASAMDKLIEMKRDPRYRGRGTREPAFVEKVNRMAALVAELEAKG